MKNVNGRVNRVNTFKGLKFTADTNCGLDWQTGFEDPHCGGTPQSAPSTRPPAASYLNMSGKEKKARDTALQQMRSIYPSPVSCDMAKSGIPLIQKHMADHQAQIDDGSSPDVAPRYVAALNTILSEYIGYVNSNCIATPPATGSGLSGGAGNTDTGLNNQPAGANPVAGAVPTTATTTVNNAIAAATDTAKKVPSWVWWAAGGLIGLVVIVKIVRK